MFAAASLPFASEAHAGEPFEVRDLVVPGERAIGQRFTLLVPRHVTGPLPLLVALHGKGETGDQALGVRAWLDRYGLGSAYARLVGAPIVATSRRSRWTAERLEVVNAELAARPFGGLAIACPYTPNVSKLGRREVALDTYARWITEEVVPRARRETPVLEGPAHLGLDGVSLGGYVGLEVFLRHPDQFGAWGSVQGALGAYRSERYASALAAAVARVGPRRLHLETSRDDVFRADNEELSRALRRRGVAHDFLAPPGGHDQPFLRDVGTIEMLLWHDRALRP